MELKAAATARWAAEGRAGARVAKKIDGWKAQCPTHAAPGPGGGGATVEGLGGGEGGAAGVDGGGVSGGSPAGAGGSTRWETAARAGLGDEIAGSGSARAGAGSRTPAG
ncbi:hypothetical protein AB1Y20_009267 [Prymnesium parvum]|uniref:Uncharacterized protein n=1 Tax=Prymnesium parvum TaxID=97485 RepID=A0AB34K4B7_PRYPA